jgi:peptidylprolyl isomerase
MKWMRFAGILLVIAAMVTGCQLKEETATQGPTDGPPPIPAPSDVAAAPADAIKTPSGLAYKVLTVGLGRIYPTPQSRVRVHYTGWKENGTMIDSSVQRGAPSEFKVTDVIAGWTEMLQLMVAGEKVRVWVPFKLAYESMPSRPQGPLVFEIELIEIK